MHIVLLQFFQTHFHFVLGGPRDLNIVTVAGIAFLRTLRNRCDITSVGNSERAFAAVAMRGEKGGLFCVANAFCALSCGAGFYNIMQLKMHSEVVTLSPAAGRAPVSIAGRDLIPSDQWLESRS